MELNLVINQQAQISGLVRLEENMATIVQPLVAGEQLKYISLL